MTSYFVLYEDLAKWSGNKGKHSIIYECEDSTTIKEIVDAVIEKYNPHPHAKDCILILDIHKI